MVACLMYYFPQHFWQARRPQLRRRKSWRGADHGSYAKCGKTSGTSMRATFPAIRWSRTTRPELGYIYLYAVGSQVQLRNLFSEANRLARLSGSSSWIASCLFEIESFDDADPHDLVKECGSSFENLCWSDTQYGQHSKYYDLKARYPL